MKNNKLIFITHNQFGYQINMYKYAQYLKEEFDISYFCFDYGKKKIYEENINIIYIKKEGKKRKQLYLFLYELRMLLMKYNYNLIILKHFPLSGLIRFFTKDRILLAIQTGSVSPNFIFRIIFNVLLRLESKLFNDIIILSDSLRKLLKISEKKATIVPLGSEVFCEVNHKYNEINLIYIGTLNNRNIDKTILGLNYYIQRISNRSFLTYTIIGFGNNKEEDNIKTIIKNLELEDIVNFVGLVPYNELTHYIENCNVGVSFVPITPYFDVQPPTKTIEYLLSGLPVIATSTKENEKLINQNNGVLIKDTADDFSQGLELIINNKYNNQQIRENMTDYKWENIINKILKPLINKIVMN